MLYLVSNVSILRERENRNGSLRSGSVYRNVVFIPGIYHMLQVTFLVTSSTYAVYNKMSLITM